MTVKPDDDDEFVRLLARMSDDAPVSITVYDFDGTIHYANEETFRLHGFTRDEFLAKNLYEIDVPDSTHLIAARMQQIREKGKADFEVQHFRKDGSTIPLHVNVKTVDWGGRKVLLSIATDLTDRKIAEEAQHASEVRYRRLFEAAKDGILILDADTGQIVDVNPFLIDLLGFSREQFLGKKIWEIGLFKDIIANKDNFEELQQKEFIRYEDMPLVTANGRNINVEFVSNVYTVNDTKVIQCNIRDITQRKLVEEERARLAAIEQYSEDAIIGKTLNGIVTSWNVGAERIFGYSAQEIVGRSISLLVPPGHPDDTSLIIERIRNGEPVIRYETLRRKKDGGMINISLTASQIRDANNHPISISTIAHDITGRKQAEEAQRVSEVSYRSLFETAQDGILILDADTGQIVDVNPFFINLLGFSREEFLGKKIWEIGLFKDIIANKDNFEELQQKEFIRYEDMPIETADGQTIAVEFVSNVYTVNDTKVIQCNIRNITDRKIAEEAQHASEVRYRSLFEAAQDGILILDAETGQIIDANPFLINLLGFSHEQFLGKKIWEIGLLKDIIANKDNFEELQRKKYTRYEDMPLETADGRSINVEFVSNVYTVDNKKVIQCNIRDITDRKIAEEAQRVSEVRYRSLFETAQDGILILDADTGQIVDVNPFFINLLGFSREEFLGKKIWEIGLFKDIIANKDNFEELQQKEYIRYEDMPIETADGRSINVEFVSNVYTVNNEKVIQCNIRDITQRKLAEDRIRILNEQLTVESTALNQTQDELRTLNNRLEEKVRERTAELKQVNLMLTEQNLTLQVMNAGTRALLIVQDEAGFMPQICNDLVRTGVYSHIWLAGIDTEGKVGIVATAGDEYPEFFRMLANGQLPACTDPVRKTGGIRGVITPDPACAGCPLSRLHTDCSTIVVRLDAGVKSVGLLGVTLQPGISTTGQETERIVQIAQEIAFVILHLRTKELEQRAFNQITKNLEQLAILNDNIRNPLQGIVGYAGIEEGELFTKIIKFAMEINSIVTKLDEGYLKSKKIRDFMERHEHISYEPDLTSDVPVGTGTYSPPHPPG